MNTTPLIYLWIFVFVYFLMWLARVFAWPRFVNSCRMGEMEKNAILTDPRNTEESAEDYIRWRERHPVISIVLSYAVVTTKGNPVLHTIFCAEVNRQIARRGEPLFRND